MDKKTRWALTDVHCEAYTQSPLVCTKRCTNTNYYIQIHILLLAISESLGRLNASC